MTTYLDKLASLTPIAREVIVNKATEYPNTSRFNTVQTHGTYLCRRCGLALFRAHSQFHSGCGWPSFDEDLHQTVYESLDADGRRMEITCGRCHAHLGHVFEGEQLTIANRRYCVNGLSLDYVDSNTVLDTEEVIVAGGCFWGVEHFMRQLPGVLITEVGYCGGTVDNPSYEQVCDGRTGHIEAMRIVFDTAKVNDEAILRQFFNIHDPTQANGQGPDIGAQYHSAIFYYNDAQLAKAASLIDVLKQKGLNVATRLLKASPFWAAEDYHQNYYAKHNKLPYCHRFEARL